MNGLEFLGVFLVGSLFNVLIIMLATSTIVKQVGGQLKGVIESANKVLEGVKQIGK